MNEIKLTKEQEKILSGCTLEELVDLFETVLKNKDYSHVERRYEKGKLTGATFTYK